MKSSIYTSTIPKLALHFTRRYRFIRSVTFQPHCSKFWIITKKEVLTCYYRNTVTICRQIIVKTQSVLFYAFRVVKNITIMENIDTADTIRQRQKEPQNNVKDELSDDTEEIEKKEEEPKKNFKYYFDRFRYYHYYYSEKIQTFLGAIGMWIIKIQLYLIGFPIKGFPSLDNIQTDSLDAED